jgi:prepilin-type N-terminal cleavage/methylation domain-containing protein
MLKIRGFTLLELIVTFALIGFLTTFVGVSFVGIQSEYRFDTEAKEIFETIAQARNNALSEKVCPNGNPSQSWSFLVEKNPDQFRLLCFDGSLLEKVNTVVLSLSTVSVLSFPGSSSSFTFPEPQIAEVLFETGTLGVQIISVESDFEPKLQANLLHQTSPKQQTICFDRYSGYPTTNIGTTCAE